MSNQAHISTIYPCRSPETRQLYWAKESFTVPLQVKEVPKFRSSGHIVNVNTCTMLKHMRPWWLCLTLDAKFELEGPNYAQTKFWGNPKKYQVPYCDTSAGAGSPNPGCYCFHDRQLQLLDGKYYPRYALWLHMFGLLASNLQVVPLDSLLSFH